VTAVGNSVHPSTLVTTAALVYLAVVAASWRSQGARLVRGLRRLNEPVPGPGPEA